jgi:uncharacterized protein
MKNTVLFLLICLISVSVFSKIPDPPDPPTLVYDEAEFLTKEETQSLRNKLETFSNETSNQIAIVVVKSLDGYDKAQYAVELGEKWGIGSKKFDNGVVILIKPRYSNEKGEVFIATGYGLEGIIPDLTTKRIIDKEIIPAFKAGNYYQGLDNATNVLMKLAKKEYSHGEYMNQTANPAENMPVPIFGFLAVLFFFFIGFFIRLRRVRQYSIGHGIPFLTAFLISGSSGRSSGSYSGFSSGSSSFGGGFGGGSFGGGGAGGSW